MRHIFRTLVLLLFLQPYLAQGDSQVPVIRLRLGKSFTKLTAGNVFQQTAMDSVLTVMPTVLWDLPTFRSRIGVHYFAEYGSPFGAIPISGIGFSGYFYPMGLSSLHEATADNVLIQKHRPSPYVYGGITPVNLNGNKDNEANPNRNISFSATLVEIMLGGGWDYPFRQNLVAFLDVNYRVANAVENETVGGSVTYSSFIITTGICTSYF